MKRFLISLIAFATIFLGIVGVALFALPDNHICNSMLGAQKQKLARLGETEGRRIVFVGGSNVGNGFDSEFLEKELGRPVINMGVHAGLGLIYQLRAIQGLLREGDVVVVVPEYEQFTGNCWGEAELLAMVSAIIPEHRRLLYASHWLRMLPEMPRYACRKLMRLTSLFEPLKEYRGYSSRGDNLESFSVDERLPFSGIRQAVLASDYSDAVIPDICDFVVACHKAGVSVCFMPPVIEHSSFEHMKDLVEKVSDALRRNGTPFIIDPERLALPDRFFYDTQYHLNSKGIPVRMQSVVVSVKSFLSELQLQKES